MPWTAACGWAVNVGLTSCFVCVSGRGGRKSLRRPASHLLEICILLQVEGQRETYILVSVVDKEGVSGKRRMEVSCQEIQG